MFVHTSIPLFSKSYIHVHKVLEHEGINIIAINRQKESGRRKIANADKDMLLVCMVIVCQSYIIKKSFILK